MFMDLWFDLAIKGERDLEEDVLARYDLSDGADPDQEEAGEPEPAPSAEFL